VFRRMRVSIRGVVQGVGFRPFVYRLATDMKLAGTVLNTSQGVVIEVEGEKQALDLFLLRLQNEKPPLSFIQALEFSFLDPANFNGFEIHDSKESGLQSALILPDIATCDQCLSEVFDVQNRRYRYPFTNCTRCGPRYTIIESLPYDRPNTSMKSFKMCAECRREYEDPGNRRFHAQPNACPVCGPQLELWNSSGRALSSRNDALTEAVEGIKAGKIVAIKGIGGFNFLVDARNTQSVETLRFRKHREEKPFALMYPNIDQIRADCRVSKLEARLLDSSESPIVLLERVRKSGLPFISPAVAPDNPYLGVMLPYSPLHHLLMKELGFPVVATSGNISEEPICIDENEARVRLAAIADLMLVHNRPIVRHMDDSVARIVMGREIILRRARGYAPLPFQYKHSIPSILAVGAHLKNTVAMTHNENIFISQHIGDLENSEAIAAFQKGIEDFCSLYNLKPVAVAADLHPDYISTKYASECGLPLVSVQHHHAHVAACMAENELDGSALGVSWDGTGYGPDDTVWGGEFLLAELETFTRIASFRKFMLPGSASAVKEPRRSALGVLYEILDDRAFGQKDLFPVRSFTSSECSILAQALSKRIQSPWTSSVGRLFDGVASLVGLRQKINFEGQAAMDLEYAIESDRTMKSYPYTIYEHKRMESVPAGDRLLLPGVMPAMTIDWEPMICAIIKDFRNSVPPGRISKKFHNTLIEIIVDVAKRAGQPKVVLTGGCFQNVFLLQHAVQRLESAGFKTYWHQRIPPNDGGISLGQIVVASSRLAKQSPRRGSL
jgi:hydrogenase maturation protein HypF